MVPKKIISEDPTVIEQVQLAIFTASAAEDSTPIGKKEIPRPDTPAEEFTTAS